MMMNENFREKHTASQTIFNTGHEVFFHIFIPCFIFKQTMNKEKFIWCV